MLESRVQNPSESVLLSGELHCGDYTLNVWSLKPPKLDLVMRSLEVYTLGAYSLGSYTLGSTL